MRVLVTGGGGFLGSHLVAALRARGDSVIVVARNRYPKLEAMGAESLPCDLSAPQAPDTLARALDRVDLVFHTAALAPHFAPYDTFFRTNVLGTRALLQAMKTAETPALVYTSTPSVVHGGTSIHGPSESECQYPTHYETPYAHTKAIAEQEVLQANTASLATISLRPHLLYGPGEPHMLPRILKQHQRGRLRRIGDGQNLVGLTYIDHAVDAHLAAATALVTKPLTVAGRAYFHHDAQPVQLWDWLNTFLQGVGEPPISRTISLRNARVLGAIAERVWTALPLSSEPPMTRFIASQLATSHYFNLNAIHQDLGVQDTIHPDIALRRTIDAFRQDRPCVVYS